MLKHEEIKKLAAEGWSTQQIAEKLGCSTHNVINLKNYKASTRGKRGAIPNMERIAMAKSLRESGMSLAEIGKQLGGVSRQRVEQMLKVVPAPAPNTFPRPAVITIWECSDGSVHKDEVKALRYELSITARREIT